MPDKYSLKTIRTQYLQLHPFLALLINGLLLFLLWHIFFAYLRFTPGIDYLYSYIPAYASNWWLYTTKLFFELFGYDSQVFYNQQTIVLEGTPGVFLGEGCMGRNLLGLFIGFILAYPGKLLSKLWYIPLGVFVFFVLNTARIVALSFVQLYHPEYMAFNHDFTFKIVVYAFIFLMWVLWINRYGRKPSLSKAKTDKHPPEPLNIQKSKLTDQEKIH